MQQILAKYGKTIKHKEKRGIINLMKHVASKTLHRKVDMVTLKMIKAKISCPE